ncbi:MAG: multiheme c-type cytochrome [Planctomycetota bacterium]
MLFRYVSSVALFLVLIVGCTKTNQVTSDNDPSPPELLGKTVDQSSQPLEQPVIDPTVQSTAGTAGSESTGSGDSSKFSLASFEEQAGDSDSSTGDSTGEKSNPAVIEEKPPLADWPEPRLVFFVTGRQHGYIEPCGCTGLENAQGGLTRRMTFLNSVRDRNWNLVSIDVGNQVRRVGKQADIKFQRTVDIFNEMKYDALGFGPDDLRLSLDGLLAPVNSAPFVSANVDVLGLNKQFKVIEAGGIKVGITSVLGAEKQESINNSDVILSEPLQGLKKVIPEMKAAGTQFYVLLAHASVKETQKIVQAIPNTFHLVVTAGGAGEPTLEPVRLPKSKSRIIQVGTKGKFAGIFGVFNNPKQPVMYERVVLDSRFKDSKRVLDIFADYQKQLEIESLKGLQVQAVRHPRSREKVEYRFVGHETCGECHTAAYQVFEGTPHFHATDSLVTPPNDRGTIARHFDPECLSCHVTGWNPQEYYPYKSGYLQISDAKLHSNGCENCHGPGSRHVDAENGDIEVTDEQLDALRKEMRLTLAEAKKNTCYTCHDIDNSPEFDFDSYWEQVKHEGVN